jgi:hypothetical protein
MSRSTALPVKQADGALRDSPVCGAGTPEATEVLAC